MVELLVIGYGNTLRSDDGVGPKVAQAFGALNLPGVSVLCCDLLTPELADPLSQSQSVVFVDAAVDSPQTVQLRGLRPADSSQIMAHAANPETMLALARESLGAEVFAGCWEKGASMTLEEALAFALPYA